ncbi:hypothetical protein TNCV_4426661 [Trichonephila clavipes]|nr:hypothetical protein TNCV_4426661 [Trichonephila clavipes]
MASAVSADLKRALQGTNRGSGPAMEKSENDVGSLEQLLLYTDEHYLAGKLPLGPFRKGPTWGRRILSAEGKESVKDDERFGRPQISRTAENMEKVSVAVRKNMLQTTKG